MQTQTVISSSVTFLDRERIEALASETERRPEAREGPAVLAAECTTLVHGADTVQSVEAASRILFSASDEVPTCETIDLLAREVPVTDYSCEQTWKPGIALWALWFAPDWLRARARRAN